MSRLVGREQMWNGMVPCPLVAVKNQEGYLSCRGSPWGARSPSPTPGPPASEQTTQQRLPTTHSRGLIRHQSPAKVLCGVDPCITTCLLWSQPPLKVNGSGDDSFPVMCQQQLRLNYNRRSCPDQITGVVVPLGRMGHLLHTATLPRPGNIGVLPNS